MTIPTEPVGSIPRPVGLIEAIAASGDHADPTLEPLYEDAIRDTIERFEATGSPVITDGEQRKYPQFLDILRTRTSQHFPGWLQDSLRRRPHPPHATADGWAVSIQSVCGSLPRGCKALRPRPLETGSHLALGLEPHVSCGGNSRLHAGPVPRRSAARARNGGSQLSPEGSAQGPDRFHRRPVSDEDRSFRTISSAASST